MEYELVSRKVADLIPYSGNARKHSEAQVAQIASSIRQFGFTNPCLIDESNTVFAGEGRLLAARKEKIESVPCIVLTGLDNAQKAAYAIADNKLVLNSSWDDEMLAAELERLSDNLSFDSSLTGFSDVEIQALLAALQPTDDHAANVICTACPETTGQEPETGADNQGATRPGTPADWSGMPDFSQTADMPYRTITIHFAGQAAVDAFANLIDQKLTDKTKYAWYPVHIKRSTKELVYA